MTLNFHLHSSFFLITIPFTLNRNKKEDYTLIIQIKEDQKNHEKGFGRIQWRLKFLKIVTHRAEFFLSFKESVNLHIKIGNFKSQCTELNFLSLFPLSITQSIFHTEFHDTSSRKNRTSLLFVNFQTLRISHSLHDQKYYIEIYGVAVVT